MSKSSNKPTATLRDGSLKCTVWANQNGDGRTRYSITISRSYTDAEGAWHESNYFNRSELLRIAHLAQKAYDAVGEAYAAEPDESDDADQGGSQ